MSNASYLRRDRRPMPLSASAWNRFFCYSCKTERPNGEREKRGRYVRCMSCWAKRGNPLFTVTDRSDFELEVESDIPQSILDAYAEAHQTSE